ncbi:MAG: Ig-like domain-containing protein, partial [Thermoanaerobaculia bacterium]
MEPLVGGAEARDSRLEARSGIARGEQAYSLLPPVPSSDTGVANDHRQASSLASRLSSLASDSTRITTSRIDPSNLPLDGISHSGIYLLLRANQPIAYATGLVRFGISGLYASDASVLSLTSTPLGTASVKEARGERREARGGTNSGLLSSSPADAQAHSLRSGSGKSVPATLATPASPLPVRTLASGANPNSGRGVRGEGQLRAQNEVARRASSLASRLSSLASSPASLAASSPLGTTDLTRPTGLFSIPVVATPADPFALQPSHPSTGAGTPWTANSSPDPGIVIHVGDLVLTSQPPQLQHVNVIGGDPSGTIDLVAVNGAGEISLGTSVQALFDVNLDPASAGATSLVVTDASTQTVVAGTAMLAGSTLTWTASTPNALAPSRQYRVTLSATLRGANGAPLGTTRTFAFTTVSQITSTEIDPSKIHITIPDANGVSTIYGLPGALPSGWRAVALRRGTAFVTQYQTTAAGDGSFSFAIGGCGGGTGVGG